MKRIALGIPCLGYVRIEFALNLRTLLLPNEVDIIMTDRMMIDIARNEIATRFLTKKAEYLFFLDDDMVIPTDFIMKLLEADKDIIGGLAFKRRDPYNPCIGIYKDGKYLSAFPKEEGIGRVDTIGMACTLIKKKVFETLKFPWFYAEYRGKEHFSEDTVFCENARKAGFEVWCDSTSDIIHLGDPIKVDRKTFDNKLKELKLCKDKNNQQTKI